MSGIDYLADTNAILYFLTGHKCMAPFSACTFAFSVISELELLSWSKLSEDDEERIQSFLDECTLIDITPGIKDRTIHLRRKYNLKLPDAIIAASAIENDLPLLSADAVFARITELKFNLLEPDK